MAGQRKGNRLDETIQLVKQYAVQETIGPLKGAGRWLGMGIAGALMLGIGFVLLLLALLRVLQEEAGGVFDGNWSFVPYLITLVAALLVIAIAASRIKRDTLQRKGEPS